MLLNIGSVSVMTSDGGGLSAEQVAQLCVDRIIRIADGAPPEIAAQAREFREQMLVVVRHYVKLSVTEDRATIAAKLERHGFHDSAAMIRGL